MKPSEMTPTTCPSCKSDDIWFKPKKGLWKCGGCEHEWTPTKGRTPLRIFLSYGRDEFAAVAVRIRNDLIDRGHEVWFDVDKLKEGGDWEQYIEDGLRWAAEDPTTGRIVFVMTPHSVRRPDGYCLNEVALALSKNVSIIPVMLVWSEPPLSIYRLQFLDMRDTYRQEDKQVVEGIYERKLERLAEALEQQKIDFQGSQSLMLKVLEPINFSADLFKLQKDFTGRQWVFALVDQWLADPDGSKLFCITGAPGAGKSAIAAYLRDNRREVAAFHFCDAASEEKRNPSKLVMSIACQLASQLSEYRERLSKLPLAEIKQEYSDPNNASTLFDKLVVQPLAENFPAPDRTLVVIIDALDEATRGDKNEIAGLLEIRAEKTPKWLRFLLTSRPVEEVLIPLQNYKPFVLDASGQDNQADLTDYLKSKIPLVTQTQIYAILEKSEGIFLYVKQVCEEIARGNLSLDRLEEFPRGLGGIYQQFFDRQFGTDPAYYKSEIVDLLFFVLAAQEPLTLGFLKTQRGWLNNNAMYERLDWLGSLFPRTGDTDVDTLRPFHKSVADWLSEKAKSGRWYVDTNWGHKLLAEAGWKQFKNGPETMDPYFLSWLPEHLKRTSDDARLVELLQSFRFMMARVSNGALEQNLMDYRSLESRLRPKLNYEQAFFRERAHILRRQNDEWPAHKILLQLAFEHANNSPLTLGAEAWLEAGRCDWEWIRRIQRVNAVGIDPCRAVMEGHSTTVTDVLQRADGTLLSCACDGTLRLWSNAGDPLKVLEGHAWFVNGVIERRDGTLLSWSMDYTLRLWSSAGDLLKVLEGHTSWVTGVLERTDGSLVSWSNDGTLRLWSSKGDPLKVLQGHANAVEGVLELRNGTLVSWAAYENEPILWSMEGEPIKLLDGHTGNVKGVLERPDGILVSWAGDDNAVRLWSSLGVPLMVLEGRRGWVSRVVVLRSGALVSWSWDIYLWSSEGDLLKVLEGHTSSVTGVLERTDGSLISWSEDGTLHLWSNEGDSIKVLVGHTGQVDGALELRNGTLVSWSKDKTLRLWSSEGDPLEVLTGNIAAVEGVFELHNGNLVSRAFCDNNLRLWSHENDLVQRIDGRACESEQAHERHDESPSSWTKEKTLRLSTNAGDLLKVLEGHTDEVEEVLERRDGTLVSWARGDPTLRLWSVEGDLLGVLEGHTSRWVEGILERTDGTLVSWSQDNTLRLWSSKGQPLRVLEGHSRSVNGALVRHDGTMVSWSSDNTLRLWSSEGDPLKVLEGHTSWVRGVLELRNGRLVSWSADNTLRLWSSKGEPLKVLEGHTESVKGILERTDGTLVSWAFENTLRAWTSSGDPLKENTLRLWTSAGDPLKVLEGHTRSVQGILERTDGTLVSWATENTLRLWSSAGDLLRVLEGHTSWVTGVLERTDGSLVSWSEDGTLRLWSSKGDPLKVLEGHTSQVKEVIERRDGTLVSWSNGGTLRLWSTDGDPLQVLSDSDAVHGYFQEEPTGPRRIRNYYLGARRRVCLTRFKGDEPLQQIIWQPPVESVSQRLYPNGRMVVTQSDGQVCFLQLYSGNQPKSLESGPKKSGS